jgi:hypothetical protein
MMGATTTTAPQGRGSAMNNQHAIYAGKDSNGLDRYSCRWCALSSHANITEYQRNKTFPSIANVNKHFRRLHEGMPQPEEGAHPEVGELPGLDIDHEEHQEDDEEQVEDGADPAFAFVPKLVAEHENDHAIYGKKVIEFIEHVYGKGCFAAKTLDEFIGFCRKAKRNSTEELKIELLELDALVKVSFYDVICDLIRRNSY